MNARRAVLVSIAALLAGCVTLDPRYKRPAPPVQANFPTGPAYQTPIDAPVGDWRAVFPEARLRAVIDQALANSRDLRVAVAQLDAARAQYHIQRADLLPTVNASAGATYGRDFTGEPPSLGGAYANVREYSASVGVSAYEVDLFGRIRSLTRAALQTYLATDEARRSTRITLVAAVATDYLTLASDESQLENSRQTVASGEATLDLVSRKATGGVASAVDVANAETIVAQARDDVARYVTQVAQDRNALDLVVGATVAPANLPVDLDDPATRLGVVPEALDSSVLLRRPDVLEAEHTLRAANANIGAARAAFFPKITLTGSAGSTSAALGGLFGGGTGVWSFAPSVSLPIFDGGANRGALAYARAEDRLDIARYEQAIQTAFEEVANALAQRGTITDRLRAEQSLVDAAGTSLRLSRALYARGSDSYLDVLTAQRTYYQARQSLIAVRLTAADNIVTLYQALGGGLTDGD